MKSPALLKKNSIFLSFSWLYSRLVRNFVLSRFIRDFWANTHTARQSERGVGWLTTGACESGVFPKRIRNSLNSANSGNLKDHWSMYWISLKILSVTCASLVLRQSVGFLHKRVEFRDNIWGKLDWLLHFVHIARNHTNLNHTIFTYELAWLKITARGMCKVLHVSLSLLQRAVQIVTF